MGFKFNGILSKGFVLSKPLQMGQYDEREVYELQAGNGLIITRKEDGYKMFASLDRKRKVRLYTDGINEIDGRFDCIKDELKAMEIPGNTLLVGEAVIDKEDKDHFSDVVRVFKSDTQKSIDIQQNCGKLRYMLFGIVFWEGYPISQFRPFGYYRDTLMMIEKLCDKSKYQYVFPVPVISHYPNEKGISFQDAQKMAVEHKWEGLVFYSSWYEFKYRLDGKAPQRPKGCYKWKPILEDDFIVRGWLARESGELKELVMTQLDPQTGREFYCGRTGTFSNAMRKELAKKKYPAVVQIAFEQRFEKTGKVRNQRFVRLRDDKPLENCIAPRSYPEEELLEQEKKRYAFRGERLKS